MRAVERLRVTTSAIGKPIAQMEERLGMHLLNRTTQGDRISRLVRLG